MNNNIEKVRKSLDNLIKALRCSDVIDNDPRTPEPLLTMFASQDVLRKEWDCKEEDEAWADL